MNNVYINLNIKSINFRGEIVELDEYEEILKEENSLRKTKLYKFFIKNDKVIIVLFESINNTNKFYVCKNKDIQLELLFYNISLTELKRELLLDYVCDGQIDEYIFDKNDKNLSSEIDRYKTMKMIYMND